MYSLQWRKTKLLHFLNDSGVMLEGRISFFFCSFFFRFFLSRRRELLYERLTLTGWRGVVLSWQKLTRGKEGVNFEQILTSIVNSPLNIPALVIWQDLSENILNKCSGKTKLARIQIDISCFLFYVINLSNQHFTLGNMLFVYLGLKINDLILF